MDLPIIVRRENLGILDISLEMGFGPDYDIGISGEDHLGKYSPLGLQSLAVQHQDLEVVPFGRGSFRVGPGPGG